MRTRPGNTHGAVHHCPGIGWGYLCPSRAAVSARDAARDRTVLAGSRRKPAPKTVRLSELGPPIPMKTYRKNISLSKGAIAKAKKLAELRGTTFSGVLSQLINEEHDRRSMSPWMTRKEASDYLRLNISTIDRRLAPMGPERVPAMIRHDTVRLGGKDDQPIRLLAADVYALS